MTWLWLLFAGAVLVSGAVLPVLLRRDRPSGKVAIAARSAYLLLGHHVDNPISTTDEGAEAALRTARERWNSAGAVLATAKSRKDFELAKRIADEGLNTLTQAYARLGLPAPGTPV